MFFPSISIFPLVTSKNLGIRFTKVDFPLPVEPMNAVVVPFSALKFMFLNTSSVLPGYLKYTSLNSISLIFLELFLNLLLLCLY